MKADRTLGALAALAMALGALAGRGTAVEASEFASQWPAEAERVWVGPAYWANRLQDWRISGGRLECTVGGSDRNVHLLTRQLGRQRGNLRMSVRLGRLPDNQPGEGWAGFRIGARGNNGDYRDDAIYGRGLNAGIRMNGALFADKSSTTSLGEKELLSSDEMELRLVAEPDGEQYTLTISLHDTKDGNILLEHRTGVSPDKLEGNLAVVCHSEQPQKGTVRFWFADWKVTGSKVDAHDERAFGPILFAQHTLSRGLLKITAQMPPIGRKDSQIVRLEVKTATGDDWKNVGEAKIDQMSRTATVHVENWDGSRDTPYRLVYAMTGPNGKTKDCYWGGTIRRDPIDKRIITVAAFTGNNDFGFPNVDIVRQVRAHEPDVLVFTGDQIYERVAGYGVQRSPVEMACLDYLRKWYLLGWSFGELLRDRPCVCLPDDHDVYHGNLWGAGGRAAKGEGKEGQDSGGYTMPPEWVRMVERTQTSHLPDPYDPTPIEQGIGVYYCEMNYGQVSFAVIEDRKFKSSPTVMIPEGKVVNGWFQNPDFDPATQADVPGATLLGQRQLAFLHDWSADWSNGAWMKVVLSQTIFSTVATLPPPANTDEVVPKLAIPQPGEYPPGEQPVCDADSNGWPQTGRNKALREMRRCFAFHIAGDQHLGSTIQYGIDDFNDAGFAVCVPAVANIWPRRWFPSVPGANREPGSPRYTGDYRDGFGNPMTVYAVSNPVVTGREPAMLYDRATGYGIVRFDRDERTIAIECWPRYAGPADPGAGGPYPGWPITINQADNYGRKPAAYLPTIEVRGMTDPVVQVVDESSGEIVYTLRIKGTSFRPKVFKDGLYTIVAGEPDTNQTKRLTNLSAGKDTDKTLIMEF